MVRITLYKDLNGSIHVPRSYAVPTEVGKVGTESPSFIEPITSRKDGIQAMFSKQRQNSPTKSQPIITSPTKRRHESSISPPPERVDQDPPSTSSQATTAAGSPQRKRLRSSDKTVDKTNKPDKVRLPPTVLHTCNSKISLKGSNDGHKKTDQGRFQNHCQDPSVTVQKKNSWSQGESFSPQKKSSVDVSCRLHLEVIPKSVPSSAKRNVGFAGSSTLSNFHMYHLIKPALLSY